MPWVLAAVAAAQVVGGIIKSSKAAKDAKKLAASRKPFETTQEVLDIQNATENRAQQGYGEGTLNYLTNQIDRAANSAYGTAKRLGANPNDLSAIFDQQIQATMRVGSESNALDMENFSKYLGAKDLLSKNMEAEWASQQGIIKDQLQSAQQRRQEGAAQISNGINTGISVYAAGQTSNLYNDNTNYDRQLKDISEMDRVPRVSADTIPVSALPQPSRLNIDNSVRSVSSIVTPTRYDARLIGFENGTPIYG